MVNDFAFFTVLFPIYTFVYIDDVIDALGCHRYVIKSEINAGQLNLGGGLGAVKRIERCWPSRVTLIKEVSNIPGEHTPTLKIQVFEGGVGIIA